ncbi:MAG TPA: hypothetical protein VN181_04320, partial [Thermoanaerobaculia bacterium]|nr:hypothetical protein [Thermoanaerobaculia bacterium]
MRRLLLIAFCCAAMSASAQPAHIQALLDRGAASEKAGRLDEAAREYAAARLEAERAGDRTHVAEASVSLGFLHYYRGELNEALVDLRR